MIFLLVILIIILFYHMSEDFRYYIHVHTSYFENVNVNILKDAVVSMNTQIEKNTEDISNLHKQILFHTNIMTLFYCQHQWALHALLMTQKLRYIKCGYEPTDSIG
jgi:hypothetical protein